VLLVTKNLPSVTTPAISCTEASTDTRCPDPTTVMASFTAPDYAAGAQWTTTVKDNGGTVQDYYTTSGAASQPGYDANGDGKLWVTARVTLRGRTRLLVTQVKQAIVTLPFPRHVITAGSFSTTNNGNKVIVDTNGCSRVSTCSSQPADLQVRCATPAPSACLNYQKSKGQVSPDTAQTGYTGGNALSSTELDNLRAIAKANGTYTAVGCPASLTGAIVFVENGNCSGGGNSAASPGMLVIARGTFSIGGNSEFYGMIYMANQQASSGAVVSLGGTSAIVGAISVDGNGSIAAGSSSVNIVFDSRAFGTVKGYADAEAVQGSFRDAIP